MLPFSLINFSAPFTVPLLNQCKFPYLISWLEPLFHIQESSHSVQPTQVLILFLMSKVNVIQIHVCRLFFPSLLTSNSTPSGKKWKEKSNMFKRKYLQESHLKFFVSITNENCCFPNYADQVKSCSKVFIAFIVHLTSKT